MTVCVFGAGSIGCYVGGRLAAAGADVTFVGRQSIADEVAEHGLHLTDLDGGSADVAPAELRFETVPDSVTSAQLVLLSVKSTATAESARTLARLLRPDTVVISLQNGLGNARIVADALPDCTALSGMVMFNVIHRGEGRFHQGTEGGIAVQDHPGLDRFVSAFDEAGLVLDRHEDLRPVQWAKLLLNLNNPVNALSGVPLRDELAQRDYRRSLSLAQREALEAMARSGIEPARLTPLPPRVLARLLSVPDSVFERVFARVIAVDPLARSSMADDLDAGRTTEIDWLCGEIVHLGQLVGTPTPVNARLLALIKDAESGGRRQWSGPELLKTLRQAT